MDRQFSYQTSNRSRMPAGQTSLKRSRSVKMWTASALALTLTMSGPAGMKSAASAAAAAHAVRDLKAGEGSGAAIRSQETADVIGVTKPELKEALMSGHTLAEVAMEKGVAGSTVVRTVAGKFTEQLNIELAQGKITQQQYEKQKESLEKVAAMLVHGEWGG
ncbi:hypothetical protein [Paenibacillus beijingensis]|uniref:Uncharacterized protein n=1 Tax=Paenibacillus beijingensis TaxID=1126833 RepID=A0A0D5NEJ3_9BACL|nr:hypothetical protein [Paenibacillus beijingensis]AJY73585.1 hypothetical protein VN24_01755 [Paenibacillus beijingensis]